MMDDAEGVCVRREW